MLLTVQILVFAALIFMEVYFSHRSKYNLYNSVSVHRFRMLHNYALKPGAGPKLAQLQVEYDELRNGQISQPDRLKELKVIFDCVEALKEIDKDLALFAEHEDGTDESLKKTAKTFTHEFLICKDQIEGQLNLLLELNEEN